MGESLGPGDRLPRVFMLCDPGVSDKQTERHLVLTLDHIVFACAELEAGADWLAAALGQPPVGGGAHPMMGTHNRLWQLDGAYLEVIAIDPGAPDPGRHRWFALDDPAMQARLNGPPALITWMARSDDLEADVARAPRDPGAITRVTRDTLYWDLTVRDDGALHWGGVYPGMIRWPEGIASPAETLPRQGLALVDFRADGPSEMHDDLEALGVGHLVARGAEAETPRLRAQIARGDGSLTDFG